MTYKLLAGLKIQLTLIGIDGSVALTTLEIISAGFKKIVFYSYIFWLIYEFIILIFFLQEIKHKREILIYCMIL